MCNANRVRRGFTLNEECPLCPGMVENEKYVLRDCFKAREI